MSPQKSEFSVASLDLSPDEPFNADFDEFLPLEKFFTQHSFFPPAPFNDLMQMIHHGNENQRHQAGAYLSCLKRAAGVKDSHPTRSSASMKEVVDEYVFSMRGRGGPHSGLKTEQERLMYASRLGWACRGNGSGPWATPVSVDGQ